MTYSSKNYIYILVRNVTNLGMEKEFQTVKIVSKLTCRPK